MSKSIRLPPPGFPSELDSILDMFEEFPFKVERLNSDNYLTWQTTLCRLFRRSGISDIVFGSVNAPAPVEVLKQASPGSPEGLYWRKRCYAWECIYITLSASAQYLYCENRSDDYDVKGVWEKIREDERSRRNSWDIRTKLTQIRLENFDDALRYMCQIDDVILELEFANSKQGEVEWKMAPDEKTFWYIHGLPNNEDCGGWITRTTIHNKDLVNNPEKLFQLIKDFDSHLLERERRIMDVKCYKCQERGHIR